MPKTIRRIEDLAGEDARDLVMVSRDKLEEMVKAKREASILQRENEILREINRSILSRVRMDMRG